LIVFRPAAYQTERFDTTRQKKKTQ